MKARVINIELLYNLHYFKSLRYLDILSNRIRLKVPAILREFWYIARKDQCSIQMHSHSYRYIVIYMEIKSLWHLHWSRQKGGSKAERLRHLTWNPEVSRSSPALTVCNPSSNSSVMFVNSQLVCLPPVGIFKPIMFIWNISFFQLTWHAWERLLRTSWV